MFICLLLFPNTAQIDTGEDPVSSLDIDNEVVDPIVIEGDSELADHPEVTGSGSSNDPYTITNITIDVSGSGRGAIAIRNTTKNLLIQNVKIYASTSATGLYLRGKYVGGTYYQTNAVIDNVTVVGGVRQLYVYTAKLVTVENCNFSNPSGSSYNTYIYRSRDLTIRNNTYDAKWQWIYSSNSYFVTIEKNRGKIYGFNTNYFRYFDVANNTFETTRWYFYSGWSSDFQGNNFTSTSSYYDLVTITDCNNLKIANNTLRGGDDILLVQHPNSYNPVHDQYYTSSNIKFENNYFIEGKRGINFYYKSGDAYVRYMSVNRNHFINCSSSAIRIAGGGITTSKVWHNYFIDNNDAGEVYKADKAQAEDVYAQFSWSSGGQGNYWSDFTTPDHNSDGYVDESYKLISIRDAQDEHPVSNPYYDFVKPNLDIIYPKGRFYPHNYVNITWYAYDNLSGYQMSRIKRIGSDWINVTGRFYHSMKLSKGKNQFMIQAIDNANLKTEGVVDLTLNESISPIRIDHPTQGEYVGRSNVEVDWTILEGYIPKNMTLSLDKGPQINVDPFKPHILNIGQGQHAIRFRSWDVVGTMVENSVDFTVDTIPPSLEIIHPTPGSVISNHQVNFYWSATDEMGISQRSVKIDQKEWINVSGDEYSALLSKGHHSFSVKVIDRTGWVQERSISFMISKNTSLSLTGPILKGPTGISTQTITWEYLANFDLKRLEITVDKDLPISLDTEVTSYNVTFREEGTHKIRVTGIDAVGNMISDDMEIIVDFSDPIPTPVNMEDGELLNSTINELTWGAIEEFGLERYGIEVDGVSVSDDLEEPSHTLNLEEGEHSITIKAMDLAGNTGEYTFTVIVDTMPPELEILTPTREVLINGNVEFTWSASDENGISRFQYSYDGGEFHDLIETRSVRLSLKEGEHSFFLACFDNAGNVRSERKDLIVDIKPPSVTFHEWDNDHVADRTLTFRWEANDNVGLKNLTLTIDSVVYTVALESKEFTIDLEEGEHTVVLQAEDIGGHISRDTSKVIIDITQPDIVKGEAVVNGDDVTLHWELGEDADLMYNLMVDGENSTIPLDLVENRFLIRGLSKGDHEVEIRLWDEAGNHKTLIWNFTIEETKEAVSTNEGGSGIFLILIIIIIILIIAGLFYFISRRKKREPEKKPTVPKRPEKISIGTGEVMRPAPTKSHHPIPLKMRSPEKPPDEGGYIRPERKKRKERGRMARRSDTWKSHKIEPEYKVTKGKTDKEETEELDSWDDQEVIEDWSEMEEFDYVD